MIHSGQLETPKSCFLLTERLCKSQSIEPCGKPWPSFDFMSPLVQPPCFLAQNISHSIVLFGDTLSGEPDIPKPCQSVLGCPCPCTSSVVPLTRQSSRNPQRQTLRLITCGSMYSAAPSLAHIVFRDQPVPCSPLWRDVYCATIEIGWSYRYPICDISSFNCRLESSVVQSFEAPATSRIPRGLGRVLLRWPFPRTGVEPLMDPLHRPMTLLAPHLVL